MKKRAIVMYLAGICLIFSSLFYIGSSAAQADRLIPRDTVIIAPVRYDTAFFFETEKASDRASFYDGFVITENITVEALVNREVVALAQLSVVDSDYFKVVELPFMYGSPPPEGNDRAVVLCRNMAWELFGAADVTGLAVYIMDDVYTVAGIVESVAGNVTSTAGFAWIPCFEAKKVGLLYINPANYNPLSARVDAESLLAHMNFQANAFTITDGNSFVQSIILRGQLLLALCLPVFLIVASFWLVRLFRSAKSKATYAAAGVFSALTLAVTVYFAWSLASIDLWLPAYVGEGLAGYSRLLFNTGTLANDVYLPMHLAALVEVNLKANVAFFTGLFGLVVIGMTRFLAGKHG